MYNTHTGQKMKSETDTWTPSPVFDLFFLIIDKIKQSIKQQTK